MEELTLEQQRAIAIATARMRATQAKTPEFNDRRSSAPDTTFGSLFKKELLNSMPAQFLTGVADPFVGAAQIASGEKVLQDWPTEMSAARVAGNIASPLGIGAAALKVPASLLGRAAVGSGIGGASGYLAPTKGGEGRETNAVIGGSVGGLLPLGLGLGGNAFNWASSRASETADLFRSGEEGAKNILRRYLSGPKVVGKEAMPSVLNAARTAEDILPGGVPTVAETVVGRPGASPISAFQHLVSKTGGGQSDAFTARLIQQQDAVKAAKDARSTVSNINYGKAFDPAKHKLVVDAELANIARNPYFETIAESKAVKDLAKARKLTPEDNLAEMLHTVKVGIDKKLKGGPGEEPIDKMTYKELGNIKTRLTDWISTRNSDYNIGRQKHAEASQDIEKYLLRQETALNPPIKTNLGGGINIAEETRQHIPNLLSRPAMIANYFLKTLGHGVEPKIDRIAAELLLNPKKFAVEMAKLPPEVQMDVEKILRAAQASTVGIGLLGGQKMQDEGLLGAR